MRGRERAWAIAVVASMAVAAPALPHATAAVAHVDVVGDDQQDSFVGTGGLVLPGRFSGTTATRAHVAGCMGCTWKYTVYCAYDSEGLCAHAVVTCPLGMVRYRVWFGREADQLTVIGSVCWGSGAPITRRSIDHAIAQRGTRYVPPLRPGFDPPGGTLVGVAVIAWAGQPAVIAPAPLRLSGMTVRLTCRGRWLWTWGDGARQWYAVPGSPYPARDVVHTYRAAGRFGASVSSRWTATYTVAGLGPFDAGGDIVRQRRAVPVDVRSSRTLLTPWNN